MCAPPAQLCTPTVLISPHKVHDPKWEERRIQSTESDFVPSVHTSWPCMNKGAVDSDAWIPQRDHPPSATDHPPSTIHNLPSTTHHPLGADSTPSSQ